MGDLLRFRLPVKGGAVALSNYYSEMTGIGTSEGTIESIEPDGSARIKIPSQETPVRVLAGDYLIIG